MFHLRERSVAGLKFIMFPYTLQLEFAVQITRTDSSVKDSAESSKKLKHKASHSNFFKKF